MSVGLKVKGANEGMWRTAGVPLRRWLLLALLLLGLAGCGGEYCDLGHPPPSEEYTWTFGLTVAVPQWSLDGDHIMFEGMSVDGVDSVEDQRLDWISQEAFRPNLSLDGSRVVYGRDREGDGFSTAIETSKPDGSGRKRLIKGDEYAFSPTWSPDGARIAFARETGLYTMAADGSDVRWIVRFLGNASLSREERRERDERIRQARERGAPVDLEDLYWHKWQAGPVWSPDGKALAYVVVEPALDIPPQVRSPSRYSLHVAAADGSGSVRVFAASGHEYRGLDEIGWPSWSPDGEQLAFVRHVPLNYESLRPSTSEEIDAPLGFTPYTIRRDGSELREVAPGIPPAGWRYQHVLFPSVSWSPDGSEVVVGLGDGHLYVAQADGEGYRQVGEGSYASWSPDGSRIAVADPLGGRAASYLDNGGRIAGTVFFYGLRLDGTEQLRDPENSIPHDYLWTISPDGSDRRVLVRRDEEGALVAVNPAPKPWYRFW